MAIQTLWKPSFLVLAPFFWCLFLFVHGCGYTLQTRANLPFSSVSLGKIENKTFEPKLQDRLNRILAETLMEYGVEVTPWAEHRIDGDITMFQLLTVSEINLTTAEYQILIKADFKLTDTKTGASVPLVGVSSPFNTTFKALGNLENVLAQKEISTDAALRDLSQELIRRMIYVQYAPK